MSNPFADLGGEEVPSDFSDLGAEVVSAPPPQKYEEPIQYSEDTVNSFQPVDQFQSYKANGQSLLQGQPDITDPDQLRQLRQYKAAKLAQAAASGDPDAQTLQAIQNYIPNTLQAIGNPSEAPEKAFSDVMTNAPISERLFQSPIQGTLPRPEGDGAIAGGVRGAENLVEGLPSVGNLTLALGLPGAPSVIQKIASAYFGVTMGHDAIQKLGDAYGATNSADRAQALVEGLGGGVMALGAILHVGGRPGDATERYPIQVDPDLGIVKTPAGPLKVANGVAQPLTPVEAQSAAALKGPEAVAPTVTEPVTEQNGSQLATPAPTATTPETTPNPSPIEASPLKVIDEHGLIPMHPDDFERESGEPIQEGATPYRDPSTNQPVQIPDNATPEQTKDIIDASRREEEMARNRGLHEDEADQSVQDLRLRVQQDRADWVNNTAAEAYKAALSRDSLRDQFPADPDRIQAYRDKIISDHRKALAGTLRDENGNLQPPRPQADVDANVADANEALQRAKDLYTEPKKYGMVTEQETGEEPGKVSTTDAGPWNNADRLQELHDDLRNRGLYTEEELEPLRQRMRQLRGEPEPAPEPPKLEPQEPPQGEQPSLGTPPPESAPSGEASEPGPLTSIKNAVTDQERAARGISPVEQAASRDFGKAWDDSAKELSLNSKAGADLVTEILKRPRPLSDTEDALLLRRQIEVQKEQDVAKKAMEAASAAGDEGSAQKASLAYNNALDELQRIYDAGHLAGTENGRGLNARKLAANQSYELGRMLSREQAAQGGRRLTPEEKAQVAEDHERIKKSGDALAEYTKGTDERASVSTAKETVKELQKEVAKEKPTRKTPSNNLKKITDATRSAVDAQVKAALERIRERSKKVYSNPLAPFAHIKDEVIIGAGHLVHGLADFADWSKAMVDQFGEAIRPKLAGILKQSKDFIDAHVRTQQIMDRIAERSKDGTPLSKMTHLVNEMAKEHVRTGITELDPLVKGLQDQLKAVYPEITERQTRDALSGYGNKQKLSTDPVDVTTRQLRGEALTTTQIEEYKSGKVPKAATGAAHQEPSQRGRELIKEKNIAKKESGLSATDPERQLKTALDTKKTTLRNQIEDYETAIDKRQRIVRGKGLSPEDSETKALTARRDELKKQYDDIFQKPELTDADRIKRAIDATNRNHEYLKQQIESGKFVKGAERKLTSPELDAAKAARDATKAQLEHLKSVDTDYQAEQNAKRQADLQARYDELDRRVKEGDIAPKAKTETPEATPALQALKDQIDAKSKELTKLQNDAKRMTPAERLANRNQKQIRDATDAIAELKRKINDKDLSVKSTAKALGTPELEALRKEREDLGKQLQKMRNEAKPKADPEATKLKAQKTAIANRLAERTAKIAAGDFSKKVRTPLVPDAELQRLQKADADSKLDYERRLYAKQQLDRSKTEKFIDAVPKWKRTWVLSGASIIAKLQSAAAALHVITPTEDLIGGALGHIPGISEIAKDAPRHGRFVLDAQVHGLTQALLRQFKNSDFVSELKTGEMDIDRIYGKPHIAPPEWSEFMGHVHGALKSSVRRAEFERSFATRMEHAARMGEDVTEPVVQTRIGVEAYKDANSSIFRQNNRLVDAYQRGLQSLVQADKTTGKVPLSARAAKAGLDYTLPIVRIPTNILARTLEYSFGSFTGGAKLAHALATGVEKLSPAEKDVIMRNLKRGSLGLGLMALGYFNPQNVGGFYQRGKQPGPNDPQFGGLRLFGHNIPRILIHNPLLETLQIGATIRKIQDEMTKKGDSSGMAFGEGAWAAAWGLAEETPVIGTPVQIAKDSERGLNYALTKQGEGISPLGLKQITEYFDKDAQGNPIKRNPQNFGQGVESGIPVLRQKVGVKSAPEPKGQKQFGGDRKSTFQKTFGS